eukprot:COSAG05_NODE_602_length_8420_cov_13.540199_1_plen_377_part_10
MGARLLRHRTQLVVLVVLTSLPSHPDALEQLPPGAEQLRRIGVSIPCVDDLDGVLEGLGMDCKVAEYFLESVGGCDADLYDGVGMSNRVPAGTMLKQLCPALCRGCPSDDIFPPPLQMDTLEPTVSRAIGTTELARARAVCFRGAGWEVVERNRYCDDIFDLNPTQAPLTLAACQALAVATELCSDTLTSNIERAPTGSGPLHTTEHFLCRCVIARPVETAGQFFETMVPNRRGIAEYGWAGLSSTRPPQLPCRRSRPSESGLDIYRCRRAPLPLPPPPPVDPNATNTTSTPSPTPAAAVVAWPPRCVTSYRGNGRKVGSSPEGTPCAFPFIWRGVVHHECTAIDGIASCTDFVPEWRAVAVLPPNGKGTAQCVPHP